ncbi:MAG TPA: hypothetical protein VHA53_06850 [Nitrolancea sp.]|nr:hypothetical protein [Nitrolancea sp.]
MFPPHPLANQASEQRQALEVTPMAATGYDEASDGDLAEAHRRWNEDVSVDEVIASYEGEWILLRITEYDERHRVTRGAVIVHDPDNEKIWDMWAKLKNESPDSDDCYFIFQARPVIRTEKELLEFLRNGGEFMEVPFDWRR